MLDPFPISYFYQERRSNKQITLAIRHVTYIWVYLILISLNDINIDHIAFYFFKMLRDMATTTNTKITAKAKTSPPSSSSSSEQQQQQQQQKEDVVAEQDNDNDANNNNNNNNNNNIPPKEPIEYNPRWRGYLFIMMFSFINFISIANVPETLRKSIWVLTMIFGTLTFTLSLLILIQDRSQSKLLFIEQFHYMKNNNGTIEGCTLLFMVIYWIVGVGYITSPAGIAYMTNNIYFSAWFTLFACVYTLNSWSDSKEILAIKEIVSVSLTLKYWWIHFIGAFVAFVSCISLEVQLSRDGQLISFQDENDAIFGIFMGLISLIVSSFFILIHYDFITIIEEGGWTELWLSLFQILIWIIALSVLTSVDGVAATTSGYNCIPQLLDSEFMLNNADYVLSDFKRVINCTTIKNGVADQCRIQRLMPGSNLYFACWCCTLSAIAIALKWKTAKALNFAQAQQQQQAAAEAAIESEGPDDGYDDDDDDP